MLEKLTGLWLLESCETQVSAEESIYPFGHAPKGRLYYAEDGQMILQMASTEREHFAGTNPYSGSDEELRMAYQGYCAYWGRYSVDIQHREITHHIQSCWFPNWEGSEQRRHFSLRDDKLILSSIADEVPTEPRHVLCWLRL